MNKIERMQYRELRFLHNDSDSDYNALFQKSDKGFMEVKRLRTMVLEIFKGLNDLNSPFMKNLFNKRYNINRRKNDLIIHKQNSITFGSNSLKCLGPHIWNTLTFPENIKEITSFEKIKEYIYNWLDLVINAVFVITKTLLLFQLI